MFVSDILSQKGGLVFSVMPATTVAEVAKQLNVRRIGSVLVLNEHSSVVGIAPECTGRVETALVRSPRQLPPVAPRLARVPGWRGPRRA